MIKETGVKDLDVGASVPLVLGWGSSPTSYIEPQSEGLHERDARAYIKKVYEGTLHQIT